MKLFRKNQTHIVIIVLVILVVVFFFKRDKYTLIRSEIDTDQIELEKILNNNGYSEAEKNKLVKYLNDTDDGEEMRQASLIIRDDTDLQVFFKKVGEKQIKNKTYDY